MKCPKCSKSMIEGSIKVQGTPLGCLFVGLSYQHCFFRPYDMTKKFIVVDNSSTMNGFYCEDCDVTIIDGEEKLEAIEYSEN